MAAMPFVLSVPFSKNASAEALQLRVSVRHNNPEFASSRDASAELVLARETHQVSISFRAKVYGERTTFETT
jgi:hypothetical protein